jgi:hypothetical protein
VNQSDRSHQSCVTSQQEQSLAISAMLPTELTVTSKSDSGTD